MRMRRTAGATLLAAMVGSTWALVSAGASAVPLEPVTVTVTTPPTPTPVTVPPVTTTVAAPIVPSLPAPAPVPVSVPEVVDAVLDCASFATQQAAQAALSLDATLAAVLDDDRDGVACELLPVLPVPVPGGAPAPTGETGGPSDGGSGAGPTSVSAGLGGSPAVPRAATTLAASAPGATSAERAVDGSFATSAPVGLAGRRPSSATSARSAAGRATAAPTAPAALVASPRAAGERADGDAPGGNVAVTVLAALLVLATAAGTFRQWKAEGVAKSA